MPPPPLKKSFVSAKVLYEIKSLVIFFPFIKVAVLVRWLQALHYSVILVFSVTSQYLSQGPVPVF